MIRLRRSLRALLPLGAAASPSPTPSESGPPLDRAVTAADVEAVFRLMLRRPVWNDDYIAELVSQRVTVGTLVHMVRNSDELATQVVAEGRVAGARGGERLDRADYLTPRDLRVTPDGAGKCLLVGSCLLDAWPHLLRTAQDGWEVEQVMFNNISPLPARTAQDMEDVRFQILHVPLRFVLSDHVYFRLLAKEEAPEALLEECLGRLRLVVQELTRYARDFGTPAFLMSLTTPQVDPGGRFAPVFSLANVGRFVTALNTEIEALCRATPSVFFYDLDRVIGVYGRKYLQDDPVTHYNHGGLISKMESPYDQERLHPLGDVFDLYRPRHEAIVSAAFGDIVGAYRALQQIDAVKLVVFDLDDTLWRGVVAEQDEMSNDMIEGWPLSIIESLAALHARGVLLALASKNDPERAEAAWRHLYQTRFAWENFFAHEVSWGDKAEAIARIVRKANVLATATLFVDDNPVERERAQRALPGLRVLEAPVAEWKRILTWSPELQPAVVTAEARSRARTLQARQAASEPSESREAFLARLDVRIEIDRAASQESPAFARVFELLNKTNQFNTTGRRWTLPELRALFDAGGRLLFARVRDAFSDYGLTAIAILQGEEIVQVVMSCRVFGLGVETALLRAAMEDLRSAGAAGIAGRIVRTERNGPSLRLFADAGFVGGPEGDVQTWIAPPSGPAH